MKKKTAKKRTNAHKKAEEAKAAVIDGELEKILGRDGSLTAEAVVAEARNPRNPLHQYFEWNERRAAERYRLEQARQMIMRSKLIVHLTEARKQEPQHVVVRKYLPDGTKKRKFKLRQTVLSDNDARAAIIDDHIKRLIAWCRAVPDIKELNSLRKHVEEGLNLYTE